MKKLGLSFKKVYFIYLIILVVLSMAAILYVNGLLHQYEDMRPEKFVEGAMEVLAKDASDAKFFEKYGLSEAETDRFESQIDVKKEYCKDIEIYLGAEIEYYPKYFLKTLDFIRHLC